MLRVVDVARSPELPAANGPVEASGGSKASEVRSFSLPVLLLEMDYFIHISLQRDPGC
jgi:hypothetical protein